MTGTSDEPFETEPPWSPPMWPAPDAADLAPTGEPPRTLSTPKLAGIVFAAWLVPQIVAIFAVPGIAEGAAYSSIKGIVQLELIPDFGTAVIALWAILRLRWWDDVRYERFATRRWVVFVPITMVVVSVATVDYSNLVDVGVGYVVLLAAATFWTGVSEELLFRGLALRALRDRHREWVAAAWSSVFFGAFHLVNILTQGGGAVFQAMWAAVLGHMLYLCRRVGGGIVLPIAVHAIWDFSSFSPEVDDPDAIAADQTLLMFLCTIVLLIVLVVRRRSIPTSPDAVA